MATITANDVKEKLSSGDKFSVFIYLESGSFVYDSEFKDGCLGVLSTEITSICNCPLGYDDAKSSSLEEKRLVGNQNELETKPFDESVKKAKNKTKLSTEKLFLSLNKLEEDFLAPELVIELIDKRSAKKFLENNEAMKPCLRKILQELLTEFHPEYQELKDTDDIIIDLGFDSIDRCDLIMKIENSLGINIPDQVAEDIFHLGGEIRTLNGMSQFFVKQLELAFKDNN